MPSSPREGGLLDGMTAATSPSKPGAALLLARRSVRWLRSGLLGWWWWSTKAVVGSATSNGSLLPASSSAASSAGAAPSGNPSGRLRTLTGSAASPPSSSTGTTTRCGPTCRCPTAARRCLRNAFGWNGEYHLSTFYGFRLFFSGGHMAVATFFVISGYVLAAKPLALIQAGEQLRVADYLASALFRRWFRLFLPLIITTFAYMTTWHLFGYWNPACEPEATYGAEVWKWYVEFKNFSFVFKEGHPWMGYNAHLWSIPLEMRGSVIVYTAVLALSRATTRARLLCELGLAVYFLYIVDGYYGALFAMGMLQCDLDMLARNPAADYFPDLLRWLGQHKTALCYYLLLASMFLAGVPSHSPDLEKLRASPGWYWMSFLKPQAVYDPKWFYLLFAANFLVAATPPHRLAQALLRDALLPVPRPHLLLPLPRARAHPLHPRRPPLLRRRLVPAVAQGPRAPLGLDGFSSPCRGRGPSAWSCPSSFPHIILLPLTIWVAEIVTRTVDEPSVRFANWLYQKALGGPVAQKSEDVTRLA